MAEQGWIALLRGINLGSRNRVPMAELRTALEEAGYDSVTTYIQSGNVLFRKQAKDRAALAGRLERLMHERFGVPAAVVLRTFAEIRRIERKHPFGADTSKTHVAFLAKKPAAAAVRRVVEADVAPDEIRIVGAEVFLRYPNGVQGTRVKPALLEGLGVATVRNWRTVAKLAGLAELAERS